ALGLGFRPRSGDERRPGLRRVPPPQAGLERVPGSDRDHQVGRLPVQARAMKRAWAGLGLRGRLALGIGALVVGAFGLVFAVVRVEMSHERHVIKHEEAREEGGGGSAGADAEEGSSISPIEDAQSDVQKTFLLVGGAALAMALIGGYLLAARTASP